MRDLNRRVRYTNPEGTLRVPIVLALLMLCLPAWGMPAEELDQLLTRAEPHRTARIGYKPPAFSRADLLRASDGTVVTGTQGGAVYGYGIVRAPISKLWSALNDELGQDRYAATSYSEVLQGQPCQNGRQVFRYLEIGVMFVSDRWWIGLPKANATLMRNSGGSVRELTWRTSVEASRVTTPSAIAYRDAGAPIGSSTGSWFLVAIDARNTWVEYHVYSDPGSGVPSGLANRLAAGGVRDNFKAMAKFANEGNPSCPIR